MRFMQGTIFRSVKDLIMTKMVMVRQGKIFYFFPKKTKGPHIFYQNSHKAHAGVKTLLYTSNSAKILRMIRNLLRLQVSTLTISSKSLFVHFLGLRSRKMRREVILSNHSNLQSFLMS